MTRTIEFLENTAKALPNQDIGMRGVVVCYVSGLGKLDYYDRRDGGSLRSLTREEASTLFAVRQA
jgi:hypothetical protein